MRDRLKRTARLARVHWFWPLALLTLPNCVFTVPGLKFNFDGGSSPYSSVIFCDIEKRGARHCPVSQAEIDTGISLSAAAVALATGQSADHALDFSPDATARCGGQPEVVVFADRFPEGQPVCLNCAQQVGPAKKYADAAAVCQAKCEDRLGSFPPMPDVLVFCNQNARASTNFVANFGLCLDGACLDAGSLKNDFVDPRRVAEPVLWGDLIGTGANANDLTRSAVTTGNFDAGAASAQVITTGDAYVEFTVNETTTTRLAGLTEGLPPDNDPGFTTIGWAIDLFREGCFYILELGSSQPGGTVNTCSVPNAFGGYTTGQRFRINVKDNNDAGHTATISYAILTASCMDGTPCPQSVIHTSPTAAHYPLHVDASFREQGGTLGNVKLVRIR